MPLLAPLADEAQLFASDLRGHGFTQLPDDPAQHSSWLTYPADLIRVLDAVGAGPYVLAGHSMGGTTSLIASAERPDLARGLVLCEPVARSFPPHLDREQMPLVVMTKKRRAVFPDRATVRRAYHGRGAFKTWPDDMLDAYLDGGLKDDPEGVRLACDPQWEAQNYRLGPSGIDEALPRVKCPIAVFMGTVESTTGRDFLDLVRTHHPDAHLQIVEGATHFLPMEHPDLVRAAIRKMLR